MQDFTREVIEIIRAIPEGKVATYGQIAELAGNKHAARQVSRILYSMSQKYQLPWHRVINAKGEIAIRDPEGAEEQRLLLNREGIEVDDNRRIDLERYKW